MGSIGYEDLEHTGAMGLCVRLSLVVCLILTFLFDHVVVPSQY